MDNAFTALHLPGGNHFDDMRLDISRSIDRQDIWLTQISKRTCKRSRLISFLDRWSFLALQYANVWEAAVSTGICDEWLKTFQDYWAECLQGRPLGAMDFHNLHFNYRCKFQSMEKNDWSSAEQHVLNWQRPANLFLTFQLALRTATNPIRNYDFLSRVKSGMRILEYGCASAPMYTTWRRFASHIPCQWTLADIPGFPFHYARHIYGPDKEAHFVTIKPERFHNTLEGEGKFDIIILQEVLEHLDHPRQVIEILTEALKPGGLLFVDYVKSDALHLDSAGGLSERMDVLHFLHEHYEWMRGKFEISERSLPQVIGKKQH